MNLKGLFKKQEQSTQPTGVGSAAFLWFNREVISRSGNPFFAKFIYRNLLPFFPSFASDLEQRQQTVMPPKTYMFFDGKALPEEGFEFPLQNPAQASVLQEAQFDDYSSIFVVAIYCLKVDFTPLDEKLHNVLGYIGMTTFGNIGFREFDLLSDQLALPFSATMSLGVLKGDGEEFWLGADELKKMGFVYQREKRR